MCDFYRDLESALGFGELWLCRKEDRWIFRWSIAGAKPLVVQHHVYVRHIDELVTGNRIGSKRMAATIAGFMKEKYRGAIECGTSTPA